jgi:REP element-mobilizing transposase RayT
MPPHRRRSTRLPDWDYTSQAWYFVTICAYQRKDLFGKIVQDQMVLNEFGRIVDQEWQRSAEIRHELRLDTHVVMPNHMHAIVIFDRTDETPRDISPPIRVGAHGRAPLQRPSRSLGSFIAGFKSRATKRINVLRGTPGMAVWQRGFYDHIIRNPRDLARIRRYIQNNPAQWSFDEYHVET